MKTMTYRALSALLDYPDENLVVALDEIERAVLAERLLGPREERGLKRLVNHLRVTDLMEAQESYVGLFDRVRSLSLHLFEHVHGESRDRGQAMVDLRSVYAQAGFHLAYNELPDYLPAFLEFLSTQPRDEARRLLEDTVHLVEGIGARLARRGSPYAAVFVALMALAGATCEPDAISDEEIRAEDDPAALDATWADQPAFGPGAGGCGGGKPTGRSTTSVVHFQRRSPA